ncbi:unnamed protein product [Rhodiola kirilowii]
MADRFERSIQDWYQNRRTADLEFLNLANPNISDLSNNITVLYDKLLLHSKISISHFHRSQELLSQQTDALESRLRRIEQTQQEILRSLQSIEDEVFHKRPLTQEEVFCLIHETKNQEAEILRITTKTEEQQRQLLDLVSQLKKTLIG